MIYCSQQWTLGKHFLVKIEFLSEEYGFIRNARDTSFIVVVVLIKLWYHLNLFVRCLEYSKQLNIFFFFFKYLFLRQTSHTPSNEHKRRQNSSWSSLLMGWNGSQITKLDYENLFFVLFCFNICIIIPCESGRTDFFFLIWKHEMK